MKYASLVVSCACLLLLQLEMGAARATGSGPSESLYATARDMGLDAAGLDEIWRTRKPLVITNANGPNEVTTVTYVLSPNGSKITKTISYKSPHRSSWGKPLLPISEVESFSSSCFLKPFRSLFCSRFAQSFFKTTDVTEEVSVNTYTENTNGGPGVPTPDQIPFLPGLQGSHGHLSPDYRPTRPPFRDNVNEPNPNERNPNERNPNERNPNERNPNERNPNERNPNERNPNPPVPEATTRRTVVPLPTLAPTNNDTVIDDFLKKIDISTSDIMEEDGEYVRMIVDTNGRILNAKFQLIDTKNEGEKSSTM